MDEKVQHVPADNKPQPEQLEDLKKTITVDTLHGDEAVRVLANYGGDLEWSAIEEKKLVQKIDRRLLSILCITYGLQYYDKAMLSQAALFGLRTGLKLTVGIRYSLAAPIFYPGFICGAYPAIVLAQGYPIEKVIFGIVLMWGACLMCTAAVQNHQGLYVQRFFLGALESDAGCGTKQEQALRMGAWYFTTGYVSIVSPLINYGLGHITGSLSPWRYMYLVAGAITILWAFVILFLLPTDPIRAKRFTDRERYIAVARMRENNSGVRNTHFKIEQLGEMLRDVHFWLCFFMALTMLVANGPVSSFTPIIIEDLGFSGLNSLLLVMSAGFVIGTIEWTLPQSATGAKLFAVYILASYGGGYAVLMSLQIANTAGYTKRSVGSSGMFIGYCLVNFMGPLVFLQSEKPYYTTGWIVTVATSAICIILAIIYRFVCARENKKRDQSGDSEAFEHAYEDDLTDRKNPQFRYTL